MTSSQSQRIQLTSCAACADYDTVVRSRVQMVCVGTVPRDGFWHILYSLDCIQSHHVAFQNETTAMKALCLVNKIKGIGSVKFI